MKTDLPHKDLQLAILEIRVHRSGHREGTSLETVPRRELFSVMIPEVREDRDLPAQDPQLVVVMLLQHLKIRKL